MPKVACYMIHLCAIDQHWAEDVCLPSVCGPGPGRKSSDSMNLQTLQLLVVPALGKE